MTDSDSEILALKEARESSIKIFQKIQDVKIDDAEAELQVQILREKKKTFDRLIKQTDSHVVVWLAFVKSISETLQSLAVPDSGSSLRQRSTASITSIKSALETGNDMRTKAHELMSQFDELIKTMNGANIELDNRDQTIKKKNECNKVEADSKKQEHREKTIVASVFGGLAGVSIAASFVTGGLSLVGLLIAVPIAGNATVNAITLKKDAKGLLAEIERLNKVMSDITELIESLKEIVKCLGLFSNFWGELVAELKGVVQKLEDVGFKGSFRKLIKTGFETVQKKLSNYARAGANETAPESAHKELDAVVDFSRVFIRYINKNLSSRRRRLPSFRRH